MTGVGKFWHELPLLPHGLIKFPDNVILIYSFMNWINSWVIGTLDWFNSWFKYLSIFASPGCGNGNVNCLGDDSLVFWILIAFYFVKRVLIIIIYDYIKFQSISLPAW